MFLDLSLMTDHEESSSQAMLVRVRRVTPQSDGTWLVGCTFVKRLSNEELSGWL
jgi:hypothetical protein